MNRRQFLTGASAAAVTAALPAAPGLTVWQDIIQGCDRALAPDRAVRWVHFGSRYFWISEGSQVIHYSEPCDPGFFVPKLT